jgi:hypothetical protein
MTSEQTAAADLQAFLEGWAAQGGGAARKALQMLLTRIDFLGDTEIQYLARPGISHSLRVRRLDQSARPLFLLMDVVGEDPAERWLSVCFYGDTVSDPQGLGDLVPGGLLGENGLCFDVDGTKPELLEYVARRVEEAHLATA